MRDENTSYLATSPPNGPTFKPSKSKPRKKLTQRNTMVSPGPKKLLKTSGREFLPYEPKLNTTKLSMVRLAQKTRSPNGRASNPSSYVASMTNAPNLTYLTI
jgi:hypothetical protein